MAYEEVLSTGKRRVVVCSVAFTVTRTIATAGGEDRVRAGDGTVGKVGSTNIAEGGCVEQGGRYRGVVRSLNIELETRRTGRSCWQSRPWVALAKSGREQGRVDGLLFLKFFRHFAFAPAASTAIHPRWHRPFACATAPDAIKCAFIGFLVLEPCCRT